MAESICFIGAGNMASAIVGGMIQQGYPASAITATSPDTASLATIQQRYQIHTSSHNPTAVEQADVVILAVKPQIMAAVCRELQPVLAQRNPLIISIAAGIPIDALQSWLGHHLAIVRAMPNIPALIGLGATALYGSDNLSSHQHQLAQRIHSATGLVQWLPQEQLMDAATAISGSAPAYFFLMLAAMEEAGIQQGLSADCARQLATQTALGAAAMAQQSELDPTQLMRNVMSPQGSIEKAIQSLEHNGFREMIEQAMQACAERANEMQRELGQP